MSRRRKVPLTVIDTNLVLLALVFGGGLPNQLRLAWQSGLCQPLVSAETLQELVRVLSYPKFNLSKEDQHELLADYLPYCATVKLPATLPATVTCRDANDQMFLSLAIAGKADVLVSGDKDLLILEGKFLCPIVMLDEFLDRYIQP